MGSMPPLLSFLLMIVSGWVHRYQLIVIEFLQAENQLLKKRLVGSAFGSPMQSEHFWGGRRRPSGAGFDETRHDSVSGYAVAVASAVRGAEMELQPQARTRPARDHARDL